jgi:primosomal protein N' (replication factor Y)
MHYYEVAPLRIVRAGTDTYTYASSEPLEIGQIVRVQLGSKLTTGIITERLARRPSYPVKPIDAVPVSQPLPAALTELAGWLQTYYATPLATVLQTMLPRGLEKTRRARTAAVSSNDRTRTNFVLNSQQQAAVTAVTDASVGTVLLHGVTGSGKTAVYIELARRSLAEGKSAIVLVPEIALTSQLVAEFRHHFSDILLTHSRQTEAERHLVWQQALTATKPVVAIGPRSALFLPLASIGLIVIDEAHEPSYKQEQSPRYQAARVAHQLAVLHGAKLVLGSATPLVTDYFMAQATKRPIIRLDQPAVEGTVKPVTQLVDMTKRGLFKRHRFLSDTLLAALEETLAAGNQALIFHNRRGSASVSLCEQCGWQAGCPRCFIPLTLHGDQHVLRCHVCNYTAAVPTMCPVCSSVDILHRGIGTKLIEAELQKLFSKYTIARFDGDSEAGQTVEARYKELYEGDIQLMVGTQILAKGLDLPKLRLVGIVQADAGLSLPDYSSAERTFQLLAQAIGRVGRSHHPTTVIVQSYQPTHPVVSAGLTQDYERFYHLALAQRKRATFPPYTHLLKLVCLYKTEAAAISHSRKLAAELRRQLPAQVEILGPTPAFYERTRDTFRWQLVLKSPKRADLLAALALVPPTHWQFELDPISLL